MCNKVFILVVLSYISLVTSTAVPFITKCKSEDTKCLKESTQKAIPYFGDGIPELNVAKHDPLVIKHVDASTPNLKLTVDNIKVTGLKNCEAKKITKDIKIKKLVIKLLCAVDVSGKYDMKGQLSILPIEGKGDMTAKIPKILITVDVDYTDKIGKDGKNHWGVKSWKHSFELKDKSNVKFENLFPDNEFLRKSTEELISTNGNDVITEIAPQMIKAVIDKVLESILNFFTAVAVEDLALD